MNTSARHNEIELLRLVADGDETAFRQIFYIWHQKVAGYLIGWTKSQTLTEELLQDVFLKLWMNRDRLRQVENFDKYIFVVSRNKAFNALRQIARERNRFREWVKLAEDVDSEEVPRPSNDLIPLIETAVQQLPGRQRKVYELKYKQGLKYEEIGRKMGIAAETARKHMQAANKAIALYVKRTVPLILVLMKIF
ncbi:MAG TPA: sigma-70 family RNA polymerase sigma factor [Parasegetibacter sp.]